MTTSEPPLGADDAALRASVPDTVRQAALSAFSALDTSSRVAPMTHDETVEDGRRLVFRDEDTTIEVDVERAAGLLRVRVVPDAGLDVALQVPGGPSIGFVRDGDGYVLRHVPVGPMAVVLDGGGTRCRTAWSSV